MPQPARKALYDRWGVFSPGARGSLRMLWQPVLRADTLPDDKHQGWGRQHRDHCPFPPWCPIIQGSDHKEEFCMTLLANNRMLFKNDIMNDSWGHRYYYKITCFKYYQYFASSVLSWYFFSCWTIHENLVKESKSVRIWRRVILLE